MLPRVVILDVLPDLEPSLDVLPKAAPAARRAQAQFKPKKAKAVFPAFAFQWCCPQGSRRSAR